LLPERAQAWPTWTRAALAGAALGVVAFASGSLILYEAAGALPALGGLAATFAAALAAGVWAGAPGARPDTPPTMRWIAAGGAVGLAGFFATVWTLSGGEQFGIAGRVVALLFLVGIPVYAVGFLLPGLAAWADGAVEDDGDAEGEEGGGGFGGTGGVVLAALLGFAFGAGVAGILFLPGVRPGLLLLATGAVLTFPFLFPRELRVGSGEERLLHQEESPFGTVRVVETAYPGQRQPELRLFVDEEIESGELARSGAPTFAYIAAAERWLEEVSPAGAAYLFLGGGAYTLPRRVAERDPTARITVVERNPAVTRAAYAFFGVRPEHGIRVLHGDARHAALALPAGAWDRVFLDVFDGSEAIPVHLLTVEALGEISRLLAPGGVLLVNVIGVSAGEGECRLWSTVRTAAEVFPGAALYVHLGREVAERQNFLLALSPDAGHAFPRRAGTFEPWPRDEWPHRACAAVYHDLEPAADGVADTDAVPPVEERGVRPARVRPE
jgi:SAM-dependent methyltransferase